MVIVAQIAGIIGMTLNVLSFQQKRNRNLFLVQCMASVFFFINYMMLGAFDSAVLNLIRILCVIIVSNPLWKNKKTYIFVNVIYILALIFTYESWWSAILMGTSLLSAYAMWFGGGNFVRKAQMFINSPVWLINGIITFSIGAVLSEMFIVSSIIISYIRYRKTGFEK